MRAQVTEENRASADSHSNLSLFVKSIGAALLAAAVVFGFTARFSGYLVDDAYIGFQYLRNVCLGHGFVFCAGQPPVEGVTNLGWLLLLLPWGSSPMLSSVAQWIGAGFAWGAILLTLYIRVRQQEHAENESAIVVFAPSLLLLFSSDFLYFSSGGMETGFMAFCVLLPVVWLSADLSCTWKLGLFGGLLTLVRPESVLILPGFLLVRRVWGRGSEGSGAANQSAASDSFSGMFIAWTLFLVLCALLRLWYFGMPLPNTFWSKPGSVTLLAGQLINSFLGVHSNLTFPFSTTFIFIVPVILAGWWYRRGQSSARRTDWLLAVTMTGLVFAVSAPLDWTKTGRYFAPYLGAALLLLWDGLTVLTRSVLSWFKMPKASSTTLLLLVELLLLTAVCDFGIRFSESRLAQYPGYVLVSRPLFPGAQWLAENTAPNAVVASRRIGVLALVSGRRVFDYLNGLTEPEVARLVSRRRQPLSGPHDPDLKGIWLRVNPDYVLEDESEMQKIARECGGTVERMVIHGTPYVQCQRFSLGAQDWVLLRRSSSE